MKKIITLLFLMALVCVKSWGQVANYTFTPSSSTYTNPLTISCTGLNSTSWDDNVYSTTLPFAFTYNGTTYASGSTIYINSNGFIAFGSAPSAVNLDAISSTDSYSGAIAALSNDLVNQSGTFTGTTTNGTNTITGVSAIPPVGTVIVNGTRLPSNDVIIGVSGTTLTMSQSSISTKSSASLTAYSGIVTQTTGTSPNQKFYIQWSWSDIYSGGNTGSVVNFQIILNQTSNTINIVYGSQAPASGYTFAPAVGLRGAVNTDFKDLSPSWSNPTISTTNNALTQTLTSSNFPSSGQIYTFSPTPLSIGTITATQQATGNIARSSPSTNILSLTVPVSGNTGSFTLSSLTVNSANTSDADITASGVKLWTGTSTAPTTQIGTAQSFSGGVATFSGLTTSITATTYLWVTYDISATATLGDQIDATIPAGGITLTASGGATAPGTQPPSALNPSGFGTIGYCTPSGGTGSTSYYLNSISTTSALTNLSYTASSYNAYVNNASTTFSQYSGSTVPVSLGVAGANTYYYYCWVDWNNNGNFNDAGETIFATTTYTGSPYSGTIAIPSAQAAGSYRVRFAISELGTITACGSAPSGNYVDFTLNVTPPPPIISSFTPTAVCTGGGTSITITGTNFTGATAVKFNGVSATSFTVVSATNITAVSPSGVTAGTISVTTGAGTATSSGSYTVNPATSITTNPISTQTDCQNATPTNLTVTAAGTGTLTYQWYSNTSNSNSGGTSVGNANGGQTATFTPPTTTAGTLYYYVIVTGTCGTVPSATSTLTVNQPPSITGQPASQVTCAGTGKTFTITGIGGTSPTEQWQYNTDGGTTYINLANGTSGNYTIAGAASASLTVTPSAGASALVLYTRCIVSVSNCSSTASSVATLTVTAQPSATISYSGTPFCTTATSASPTINGTQGGTFSSTTGLTITSAGVINPSTSTAGTYTVTYTVAASGGCSLYTTTTSVTINTAPSATISYASPFCSTVTSASPTITGTTGGTFSSTTGLTITASSGVINPSTSTAGTYTVTYTVAAAGGCSVYTTTASVTITANPSGTFSYNASPYCSTVTSASPTTSSLTSGGTYSSTSGLSLNTSTGAITPSTSTAGTYTVTYTVATSGGCATYSTTASVTINAAPSATISYASPFCSTTTSASPTITGTTGGMFSSTTGLSISSSTGVINPSTSTAGTYTVTYTVAAAGGCATYSTTASVTITAVPSATISYSGSPFCSTVTSALPTITGTTGGTFSSTTGLTIIASTGKINPSTSTAGTYTVTYTVAAAGGCSVYTTTASVTITANPSGTFSYNASPYCSTVTSASPTTSSLTSGGTYSSTTGLSISSSTGVINPSASTAGTYTVTYTVAASGGCAVYTTTASVTITAAPSATISYASPFCSTTTSASPTITGTTGGTFSSTTGLSISSSTGVINPSTSTAGTYTVTYTVAAAGGCSVYTTTASVTINTIPTFTSVSASPSPVCSGVSSQLFAAAITSSAYTYTSISSPSPATGSDVNVTGFIPNSNNGYKQITLPFTFNFYGTNYSTGYIGTNGYVGFGATPTTVGDGTSNATIPSSDFTSGNLPLIALCFSDLNLAGGGSIDTFTTGTAPYRKYIIKYSAVRIYTGTSSSNITGQIELNETSNIIDLFLSMVADGAAPGTIKAMGIQNSATTGTAVSGRNGTDWTVSSLEGYRFTNVSYSWSPATGLSSSIIYNPTATLSNTTSDPVTTTYTITATGNNGCTSTSTVGLTVNPATVIATQPANTTYCPNATSPALSVTATGTGTLTYQWYSNSTNSNSGGLSVGSANGGQTASFTPSTTTPGTYYYYVVITGTCGSTTSSAATITVTPPPQITSQPSATDQSLCLNGGNSYTLSVTASGTGTLTYQWYSNSTNSNTGGTLISGATSTSYIVPNTAAGSYYYYVIVSSSCSTVTSNVSGKITVTSTSIDASPTGATYCQNSTATALTVSTSGSNVDYQWYSNTTNNNTGGTAIVNATGRTYLPSTAIAGTYYYYVIATGTCGSATSATAQVVVNPATAITGQPSTSGQVICQNVTATQLTVNAVATNITYQWYSNSTNSNSGGTSAGSANGGQTATFTPPTATPGTTYYYVVVSGTCSPLSQTSNASGAITVNPNATIALTSGAGTDAQTPCAKVAITTITYSIGGGGTNASITSGSLPTGVSGSYSGGVFTISGTPTVSGSFNYTITTTGGSCNQQAVNGTITVKDNAFIALTSAAGTDAQTPCVNTTITNITYQTSGSATSASITSGSLPSGVTGSYNTNNSTFTITGTPTVSGSFNYTITTVGGSCNQQTVSGTITVQPNATITLTSGANTNAQSICSGSGAITTITYAIGGTGNNATVTGLPTGVTGSYSGGVFTISGTPGVTGTFNYTVTATGTCAQNTATGSITINQTPSASFAQTSYSSCAPTAVSVVINGTAGATVSYTINGGNTLTVPIGSGGNATLTSSTTANTYTYLITGISLGTCSGTTGGSNQTSTVIVHALPDATISFNPGTGYVQIGNTITLTDATSGGTWTNSTPAVATLSTGTSTTVKGVASGQTTVGYTTPTDQYTCSNTATKVVYVTADFVTKTAGNFSDYNTWNVGTTSGLVASTPTTNIPTSSNTVEVQHALTLDQSFQVGTGKSFNITNSGTMTILPNITFSSLGTVAFNGNLVTVKSDATGTGAIGLMASQIAGASNVTAERFIGSALFASGKRAWRLLTAPVSGQTINNAWQEGLVSATNTPTVGSTTYGTLITGTQQANATNAANHGFDFWSAIANANTSIVYYTPGSPGGKWNGFTSIKGLNIENQPAYLLFVRGNRSVEKGATAYGVTTLRANGTLNQVQKSFTVGGSNAYTLVGNPFAAPIDFEKVYTASSNIQPQFLVWNSQNGVYGAYALVQRNSANNYSIVPNAFTTGSTSANARFLVSGQGFFVQPASSAGGTLVINEAAKDTTAAGGINPYRLSPATDQRLYVNLNLVDDTTTTLADGVLARFDATYAAAIDGDDVPKQSNFNENIAIESQATSLIVEARPEVVKTDTVHLKLWNETKRSYQLQLKGENFAAALNSAGLHAFLQDSYLGTSGEVSLTGSITTVGFTVNSDSASQSASRFRIVFQQQAAALPVTLTSVSAAPQTSGVSVSWTVTNETGIKDYVIERSTDGGTTFTAIATQGAKNNPGAALTSYNSLDVQPHRGDNLYRIRIEGRDGTVSYSKVVKAVWGEESSSGAVEIAMYPNPVGKEGKVSLQLSNLKEGTYLVRVYSEGGQTVYQRKVVISQGGSAQSEELRLGNSLAQGSYQLRLTDSKGSTVYAHTLIIAK